MKICGYKSTKSHFKSIYWPFLVHNWPNSGSWNAQFPEDSLLFYASLRFSDQVGVVKDVVTPVIVALVWSGCTFLFTVMYWGPFGWYADVWDHHRNDPNVLIVFYEELIMVSTTWQSANSLLSVDTKSRLMLISKCHYMRYYKIW